MKTECKFLFKTLSFIIDLKPQNIMVVMNQRKLRTPVRKYICKLFDFGCSARLDEPEAGQNIGVCLSHQI